MTEEGHHRTILMVDDDDDDFFLVKSAFEEIVFPFRYRLSFLPNGQDLMDYLHRNGKYSDPAVSPWPCLILLDLNMPRKNGREALKEIKADPALSKIPIVIFTTSSTEEDKVFTRNLGAVSFITKPARFDNLVDLLKRHGSEWCVTDEASDPG